MGKNGHKIIVKKRLCDSDTSCSCSDSSNCSNCSSKCSDSSSGNTITCSETCTDSSYSSSDSCSSSNRRILIVEAKSSSSSSCASSSDCGGCGRCGECKRKYKNKNRHNKYNRGCNDGYEVGYVRKGTGSTFYDFCGLVRPVKNFAVTNGTNCSEVKRSEEHTSERQSPVPTSSADFCLNKKITYSTHRPNR